MPRAYLLVVDGLRPSCCANPGVGPALVLKGLHVGGYLLPYPPPDTPGASGGIFHHPLQLGQ